MSVRLKSRQQAPVNGFQFYQAETGMEFKEWSFDLICEKLRQHRLVNPRFNLPTDLETIREEVDTANALRMLSIRGAESYVSSDEPLPKSTPPQRVLQGAANLVGGAKTILSMFGKQGPTNKDEATRRAAVCAECPLNAAGDWLSILTGPTSLVARKLLGIAKDLNLKTEHDDKLGICSACDCPLATKVWARREHILAHIPAESKAKLDARCWILAAK